MITCITFDDISPAYLSAAKLRSLLKVLDRSSLPCTLFVVPGKGFSSSSDFDFESSLKTALSIGHELSLHGYKHTLNEFGYLSWRSYGISLPTIPLPSFEKQKRSIQRAIELFMQLTGVRPLGFRAPYYRCNNHTLNALSSLGFHYDSTKTVFRPVYGARFRLRWSRYCKPYTLNGLMEIPVTGDYTYNLNTTNFADSLKRAIWDFEWILSRDGVFVINIHPDRPKISLLDRFLSTLVQKIEKRTRFSRLVDISL